VVVVRIIAFSRLFSALLLATVATVGLASATPAWAVDNISINPGNVPTTAAGFSSKECDPNLGGGPFPGQDVWVFVLPNPNVQGTFLSLHLNFSTPTGPVTRDIPADPNSGIVNGMGTSKAFIRTPAGWTLTDATTTAMISGTGAPNNPHFNLTHTCPTGFVPPTVPPTGAPTGAPNAGGGGTAQPSVPFWMSLAAAGILAPVAFVLIRRRRVTNG
jgi:hypothetical protein